MPKPGAPGFFGHGLRVTIGRAARLRPPEEGQALVDVEKLLGRRDAQPEFILGCRTVRRVEPAVSLVQVRSPDCVRADAIAPEEANPIEEFITRAGTDYGVREVSLDDKVKDVERQIRSGEARIVFDTVDECANIVPRR